MFDLSRAIETFSRFAGRVNEMRPQASDVPGDLVSKVGLDPTLVETLRTDPMQVVRDGGMDAAARVRDALTALIDQPSHGLEKPP